MRDQWPIIQQIYRQQSTAPMKYDLLVGIQLERLPVVTKSLNKIQREYQVRIERIITTKLKILLSHLILFFVQELLTQLEFENSHKSDFEIQSEKDIKMAEMIKSGKIEVDFDAVTKQTSQDLKDLWKEERSKFQLASRITEADKTHDTTSTNRKLEDPLTLIIEQKIGDKNIVLLPQGQLCDGETLRQAAERIIKERCGESLEVQFYGNAPCGYYKFKYPKQAQKENVGAKLFFYRAVLKSGQVDKKLTKFEWLDRDELLAKFDDSVNYKRCLKQFII